MNEAALRYDDEVTNATSQSARKRAAIKARFRSEVGDVSIDRETLARMTGSEIDEMLGIVHRHPNEDHDETTETLDRAAAAQVAADGRTVRFVLTSDGNWTSALAPAHNSEHSS